MSRRRSVLLLAILAVGVVWAQWSEPAVVVADTWPPRLSEQNLIAGPGDTCWVFYNRGTRYEDTCQLRAQWSTGDTWSAPEVLVRSWLLSCLGVGVDPRGRIWLAWYNGDYLIDSRPEDTWGIWTCIRDSGRWTEPELAINPAVMETPAGHSFAADREGNWYMGIEENTAPLPDLYESAMYSRLEGDTWTWPRYIARGWGSPVYADNYLPTLTPHPDSGLWSVHKYQSTSTPQYLRFNWVVNDSVYEVGEIEPVGTHEAVGDSAGRMLVAYGSGDAIWCAFCEEGSLASEEVSTDICAGWVPVQICYDSLGWIWLGWTRADTTPVVSYRRGDDWWSDPEPVTDSTARLLDLTTDTDGRVYAMFYTQSQRWYTTYREERPGVAEEQTAAGSGELSSTLMRGALMHAGRNHAILLDITGRKVMDLSPGPNGIRHIAPGVYFVRRPKTEDGRPKVETRKVVVQR